MTIKFSQKLAAIVWLALVTYSLLSPKGDIPRWPWLAYPGVDKAVHFCLYLIMAGLWAMAFEFKIRTLALLLIAHGLFTELAQGILPIHRETSLFDLAADAVGVLVGLRLAQFFNPRVN